MILFKFFFDDPPPSWMFSLCVAVCVFAGQARDLGETVEMFQDATVQPFLYPAAFDLWNLLLH